MQRNKNVSIQNKVISNFRLIPRPSRPHLTRWKHGWMTHLIQAQGKNQPNQCCHLINNPYFRLNAGLIINTHPLRKPHHGAFTSKQEILERIKHLHKIMASWILSIYEYFLLTG